MDKDWGFNFENNKFETSLKRYQVLYCIYQSEVQGSGPEWRAKRAVGMQTVLEAMIGNEITQQMNVNREKGWPKD